jgi:2-methylcitrate dehydratase PrpD
LSISGDLPFNGPVVGDIGRSIAALTLDRVDEKVRAQAKYRILDALGVAVAGAGHPLIVDLSRTLGRLGESGQSTVLGSSSPRPLWQAVLTNGTMMQVHDFDEAHLPSHTHPTAAILPPLLAMAEQRHGTGADLLEGFIAGYEATARIGQALAPELYMRGWHASSTVGVFGAAAAVGRLLRLDPQRLGTALNLAGTMASGVRATFGSASKHLHFGKAALNGVLAASWAEVGIAGGRDTFADPLGFAAASSGSPRMVQWETQEPTNAILDSTIKLFPCCLETHSALQACLRLRERGLTAVSVEILIVRVRPEIIALVGNHEPETGMEAKFSLPHCISLAMTRGRVVIDDFVESPRARPEIMDLRGRVKLIPDTSLEYTEAIVEIRDVDGKEWGERVIHVRGTPQEPLTSCEIETKFFNCAMPILGETGVTRLRDRVLSAESLHDCADLLAACRPNTP